MVAEGGLDSVIETFSEEFDGVFQKGDGSAVAEKRFAWGFPKWGEKASGEGCGDNSVTLHTCEHGQEAIADIGGEPFEKARRDAREAGLGAFGCARGQ
jgi:hypothetical protein